MKDKKEVLIGLANVLDNKANSNLLKGSKGAYVNILCYALNDVEFIIEATKALNEIGLKLIDIEDIEPISERAKNYLIDDNLITLAKQTNEENRIMIGVLHTYD